MLYLLEEKGVTVPELTDCLYKQSGLLGISGISPDMRVLEASDDPRAEEAIAYFVHRCVREIGALAAALGGVDALVFTRRCGRERRPRARAHSGGLRMARRTGGRGRERGARAADHGGGEPTVGLGCSHQ